MCNVVRVIIAGNSITNSPKRSNKSQTKVTFLLLLLELLLLLLLELLLLLKLLILLELLILLASLQNRSNIHQKIIVLNQWNQWKN